MSDYIKDLNIIDFLGITVPGCLLVLLISGDNPSLLLWASYFGADAGPAIRGIFLAIAGYVIGMILHEIGDLAEKGTWCFTLLDPKAYAIRAVGIDTMEKAAHKAQIPLENTEKTDGGILTLRIRGILGCLLAFTILFSCTVCFPIAMSAAAKLVSASQSIGLWPYVISLLFLMVIIAPVIILGSLLWKRNKKGTGDNQNKTDTADIGETSEKMKKPVLHKDMLEQMRLANPQIQTYLAEKCAPKKLNMFDSFRHVMRNSLIAIAIVNGFSIWHPVDLYRDVAIYFSEVGYISCDISMATFWFCGAVVVTFSRYAHFAYLRYKYGYEAFVSKAMSGDKPEVSNYHVVLIQKNSDQ